MTEEQQVRRFQAGRAEGFMLGVQTGKMDILTAFSDWQIEKGSVAYGEILREERRLIGEDQYIENEVSAERVNQQLQTMIERNVHLQVEYMLKRVLGFIADGVSGGELQAEIIKMINE